MVKSRKEIQHQFRVRHPNYYKDYNARVRREVLGHYSGVDIKCACCDERNIEFLSIDHINGGGTKHRSMIGYGGGLCQWLRAHKYPVGYRVLCNNCNFSLGHYNYCPHQKDEEDEVS